MPPRPGSLAELSRLPIAALEDLFERGFPVDLDRLVGHEFHGMNFGTPALFDRRFRKFRKVFFREPGSGRCGGWNLRTQQNGDDQPWLDAPPPAGPVDRAVDWLTGRRAAGAAHGFFAIRAAVGDERIGARAGALLIDYGGGRNPWADVSALLRDVAVCVAEGDHDLLVGRAYLALGPARVRAKGVFALARAGAIRDDSPISFT